MRHKKMIFSDRNVFEFLSLKPHSFEENLFSKCSRLSTAAVLLTKAVFTIITFLGTLRKKNLAPSLVSIHVDNVFVMKVHQKGIEIFFIIF